MVHCCTPGRLGILSILGALSLGFLRPRQLRALQQSMPPESFFASWVAQGPDVSLQSSGTCRIGALLHLVPERVNHHAAWPTCDPRPSAPCSRNRGFLFGLFWARRRRKCAALSAQRAATSVAALDAAHLLCGPLLLQNGCFSRMVAAQQC